MTFQKPETGIVTVYTTNYCPYCVKAKSFLAQRSVLVSEVDVTENQEARLSLIEMTGGRKTVPQIFIGLKSIGGYDDMMALVGSDSFFPMLKDAGISFSKPT